MEAWTNVDENKKHKLNIDTKQRPLDIFQSLFAQDAKHKGDSWFRKGQEILEPWLQHLQEFLNYAGPFIPLDTTGQCAFGAVKTVISVSA